MSNAGDIASRYQLENALGWKGSVRTFRGRDPSSGETVAVKTITLGTVPEAQAQKQRFLSTAGVLKSLQHANLPSLLEYGVGDGGEAYMIFAWIDGVPLDRLGPMAPRQLLPYMLQAIEGLECMALHGLVHLNLAADNLLVTRDGEIKLVGLGTSLFRVDWQSPLGQRAQTAVDTGVAPELKANVTAGGALWRADLYALAHLTAILLGARVRGQGTADPEVRLSAEVLSHLQEGKALEATLASCLHRDPNRRPVSYSQLGKVLQHALPRAPRASKALRETQAFDVAELSGQMSTVDSSSDESAEISELRRGIEEELEGSELKGPQDLGAEAEIYEGFLELREDSGPAELDLWREDSAAGVKQPSVAPTEASSQTSPPEPQADGSETVLVPRVDAASTEGAAGTTAGSASGVHGGAAAAAGANGGASPGAALAGGNGNRAGSEATPSQSAAPKRDSRPARTGTRPRVSPPRAPSVSPSAPDRKRPPAKSAAPASATSGQATPRRAAPSARAPGVQTPMQRRAAAGERAAVAAPRPAARDSRPASDRGAGNGAGLERSRRLFAAVRRMISVGVAMGAAGWRRFRGVDRRILGVVVGIVAMVAVSALVVALWPAGDEVEVAAEPPILAPPPLVPTTEAPAREEEKQKELPAELTEALLLLSQGQLLEARARLDDLSDLYEEGENLGEQAAFFEELRAAEETLVLLRAEQLTQEIGRALENGDATTLRATLGTLSQAESEWLATAREGRLLLADANRARRHLDDFEEAVGGSDTTAALNAAFELAEAFPVFSNALRSRERASAAVEAEVDRMIEDGRLEEAQNRVELLKSMWPERPGLDGRLQLIRSRLDSKTRFSTLLQAADAAAARNRPHEGLSMLDGVTPSANFRARFREARARLLRQLGDLDEKAPTVGLKPGSEVVMRKGTPVVIDLHVEDDYQVTEVTFWARSAKQEEFSQLTVRRSGEGMYRVEIAPSFHRDKPILFWVTASDHSGHRGQLGSREEPVELRRRRPFKG